MEIQVVPCEYYEARTMTQARAFWVRVWLLFEPDGRCHSFLHYSDLVDNCSIAEELGVKCYVTSKHLLCNSEFLPDVYKSILEYENVLKSKGLAKPRQKYTFTKH